MDGFGIRGAFIRSSIIFRSRKLFCVYSSYSYNTSLSYSRWSRSIGLHQYWALHQDTSESLDLNWFSCDVTSAWQRLQKHIVDSNLNVTSLVSPSSSWATKGYVTHKDDVRIRDVMPENKVTYQIWFNTLVMKSYVSKIASHLGDFFVEPRISGKKIRKFDYVRSCTTSM